MITLESPASTCLTEEVSPDIEEQKYRDKFLANVRCNTSARQKLLKEACEVTKETISPKQLDLDKEKLQSEIDDLKKTISALQKELNQSKQELSKKQQALEELRSHTRGDYIKKIMKNPELCAFLRRVAQADRDYEKAVQISKVKKMTKQFEQKRSETKPTKKPGA